MASTRLQEQFRGRTRSERPAPHFPFSSSGELFLTLPTSLLTSKASISSAGNGRRRSIGGPSGIGLAVEPTVEVSGVQDDRHPVVYLRHQLVRVGGNDGVALQPLAVGGVFPSVPQPSEGHHLAVEQVEGERLLVLRVEALPLISHYSLM